MLCSERQPEAWVVRNVVEQEGCSKIEGHCRIILPQASLHSSVTHHPHAPLLNDLQALCWVAPRRVGQCLEAAALLLPVLRPSERHEGLDPPLLKPRLNVTVLRPESRQRRLRGVLSKDRGHRVRADPEQAPRTVLVAQLPHNVGKRRLAGLSLEPRVLQAFRCRRALVGVDGEHLGEELLGAVLYLGPARLLHFHHPRKDHRLDPFFLLPTAQVAPIPPKRQGPRQQHVHEAADAPHVCLVVVPLVLDQELRSHVVKGPAILGQVRVLAQLREPKVRHAQPRVWPLVGVEDVVWLEVAVHDAPLVHVGTRVQNVRHHGRHLLFRVPHPLDKLLQEPLHQLAPRRKLHNHPVLAILLGVPQVVVELDNVLLRHHLVGRHLLINPDVEFLRTPILLLDDALCRKELARLLVLCLPHFAIVAFPQQPPQLVQVLQPHIVVHAQQCAQLRPLSALLRLEVCPNPVGVGISRG
mmetsp:Transcript_21530/g.54090  ORF Transcript_21530/g.54090 Transcript_21530/m.54090 type:complete len:469 (+) Transcript_21530:1059-2465(+)